MEEQLAKYKENQAKKYNAEQYGADTDKLTGPLPGAEEHSRQLKSAQVMEKTQNEQPSTSPLLLNNTLTLIQGYLTPYEQTRTTQVSTFWRNNLIRTQMQILRSLNILNPDSVQKIFTPLPSFLKLIITKFATEKKDVGTLNRLFEILSKNPTDRFLAFTGSSKYQESPENQIIFYSDVGVTLMILGYLSEVTPDVLRLRLLCTPYGALMLASGFLESSGILMPLNKFTAILSKNGFYALSRGYVTASQISYMHEDILDIVLTTPVIQLFKSALITFKNHPDVQIVTLQNFCMKLPHLAIGAGLEILKFFSQEALTRSPYLGLKALLTEKGHRALKKGIISQSQVQIVDASTIFAIFELTNAITALGEELIYLNETTEIISTARLPKEILLKESMKAFRQQFFTPSEVLMPSLLREAFSDEAIAPKLLNAFEHKRVNSRDFQLGGKYYKFSRANFVQEISQLNKQIESFEKPNLEPLAPTEPNFSDESIIVRSGDSTLTIRITYRSP